MATFDIYQEITNRIMEMLEAGTVPWRSPIMGRGTAGHPKNLDSRKNYRGVNVFLLAFTAYAKGYGSSYWATYRQVQEMGGHVKKGEKSSMVIFFKQYETKDKATGDDKKIPVLRYFNVFNAEQCEGLEAPDVPKWEPIQFEPVAQAEAIMKAYPNPPTIEHGGTKAFYRPSEDRIQMPEPARFTSSAEYYSTLFHEAAHSTGHSSRLDRGLDTDTQPFGTPSYGREELIAEMASAFMSARAGIAPAVIENQAAYLQGWIKTLKGDKKLVISAASAAQKATDWILNEKPEPAP